MNNTYQLTIGKLKRDLPIVKLSDELSIASFVILGDTQIVAYCSQLLSDKLPDVDVLITAEAKGIPLTYEISKILKHERYVVARKSIKSYMNEPVINEVMSITTEKKQILCLDKDDAAFLKNKNVGIIDDVISTGGSIKAIEDLVEQVGGNVVAKAAILAEGEAASRKDIIFLEKLPLLKV